MIWYLQPSIKKVLKPSSPGAMDLARGFFVGETENKNANGHEEENQDSTSLL